MKYFVKLIMLVLKLGRFFRFYYLLFRGKMKHEKPPKWKELSPELQNQFTMNGKVKLEHFYQDSVSPVGVPIYYSRFKCDFMIKRVKDKSLLYYGDTFNFMCQAIEQYPVRDKTVAIMGSHTFACEAIVLAYGGRPITIEYNKLITDDSRLTLLTVEEYKANPIQCDMAFSISSFEHDGLGRYGDPLNPDGDLQAMQEMKTVIKPGGILFLSLPIGQDKIIWNEGRMYGEIRLNLLLKGWTVKSIFGKIDYNNEKMSNQPVIVLQNN